MGQNRVEALVLATVEKDLLMNLSMDDMVAKFAGYADRRFVLI